MPSRPSLIVRAEAAVEAARSALAENHAVLDQVRAIARPLRAARRIPDPEPRGAPARRPSGAPPA
ncbi:hypothetical protein OPKNFCMD_2299 [Methylobacterium crusticola]|uniref:Uncharacterized protein n=1 Tax=Methylobacterium crusticola TaxID=1697972 RepID=A0ABQ4QYB8_9HYPH|nr:hypothetical protein [Methylobacterium crusticola]GJD49567.1 hypothetical protein OPKNFCMD_2299 [Methylobacterium crusticola]